MSLLLYYTQGWEDILTHLSYRWKYVKTYKIVIYEHLHIRTQAPQKWCSVFSSCHLGVTYKPQYNICEWPVLCAAQSMVKGFILQR